jgi:hypothetical protein
MVSPTTRPAASRARSATCARTSANARWRSDSMSAVAFSRSRSISARVSAICSSRLSSACFWARASTSFASCRAAVSVARRSAAACSRSTRASSASFRPCSMRARRVSSVPDRRLKPRYQASSRNTRKLAATTRIQKKLMTSPGSSAAGAALAARWPRPTARARIGVTR